MNWTYNNLWQKSKLYMDRALAEDREEPLFPLWASLALELLARASIAKIHPALLADPKEGENIMYAFELLQVKNPKSIPTTTAFRRCMVIVPDFTEREFKDAMIIIERRNEELHSGGLAFHDLPTRLWLSNYYRICDILLRYQGKSLIEFLGDEDGDAALRMIAEDREKVIGEVMKTITKHAKDFQQFAVEMQEEKRRKGKIATQRSRDSLTREVECPSCNATALLSGDRIREFEPNLREDTIVQEVAVLPTQFECFSCGLKLESHAKVDAANFGGQYQVERFFDPIEYYGADIDPADYDEPDYGND
jgi:transcription elongation factor Elf1